MYAMLSRMALMLSVCLVPKGCSFQHNISAMRPPCYPFVEEIVILGVIYGRTFDRTALKP